MIDEKKLKSLIAQLSALVEGSSEESEVMEDAPEMEDEESSEESQERGSFRVKSVAAMMKKKMAGA